MAGFLGDHTDMRIEGPRKADSIRKNEKARKSGAVSSDFSTFLDAEVGGAEETKGAAPIADVGALIAAQAADDPAERKSRQRMQDRAGKVLDALESVQRGLINGQLSVTQLENISRSMAERREKINDPRLLGIMDDVDLRAQVELAKLEMARDKHTK
jgi:hypothetical protein